MCGIAGTLNERRDVNLAQPLRAMLSALRHRGPDDGGSEEIELPGETRLGLAHSRLSIIDVARRLHHVVKQLAATSTTNCSFIAPRGGFFDV